MGLVLAFDAAPRRASRPPATRRPAESAAILFFTGVRYERERQSASPQPSAKGQNADPTPSS